MQTRYPIGYLKLIGYQLYIKSMAAQSNVWPYVVSARNSDASYWLTVTDGRDNLLRQLGFRFVNNGRYKSIKHTPLFKCSNARQNICRVTPRTLNSKYM